MNKPMLTPQRLIPALRQYRHNSSDGLIAAYDYNIASAVVTTLEVALVEARVAHEYAMKQYIAENERLKRELANAHLIIHVMEECANGG